MNEYVIENNSNATISEGFNYKVTFPHTSYRFIHPQSYRICEGFQTVKIKGKVEFKLFGSGGETETNVEGGFDENITNTYYCINDKMITIAAESTSFVEDRTVNVSPNTSIKINAYINMIENLPMKYKARLTVHGGGPIFDNGGTLSSVAIKSLLQRNFFNLPEIKDISDSSVNFQIEGLLNITIGTKSMFEVTNLNSQQGA